MGLDMYLTKIDRKVNNAKEIDNILVNNVMAPTKKEIEAYNLLLEGKAFKAASTIRPFMDIDLDEFSFDKETDKFRYKGRGVTVEEHINNIGTLVKSMYDSLVPRVAKYINCENKEDIYVCQEELYYWRKHPNLHGYMEKLYSERGGTEEFNCVKLILTKEDIETLIDKIKREINGEKVFENVIGFFFGKTCGEEWKDDLEVFTKVLEETNWDKETVYYDSWW